MRCFWCGGEICEIISYDAQVEKKSRSPFISRELKNRYYCSPACLRKNIQSFFADSRSLSPVKAPRAMYK